MSKRRSKMPTGTVVLPLRVPGDMQQKIRRLADKSRLSDADIMRMSIERGISAVEKMFETVDSAAA